MKIVFSFIVIFLFIVTSNAQSRVIGKDEYDKVFQFAVVQTNADYPVILKVVTTEIENGKTVSTSTEINENESPGRDRIKRTVLEDGKQTNQYQVSAGSDHIFCSDDGVRWTPSEYECARQLTLYGQRNAESIEYSVTEKSVSGKKVKIYREYSVFPLSEESRKKEFREKVSTIDSRGFFITVEDTEGTLDPKTITLVRKQSWMTKAKIKPVVAPIK